MSGRRKSQVRSTIEESGLDRLGPTRVGEGFEVSEGA